MPSFAGTIQVFNIDKQKKLGVLFHDVADVTGEPQKIALITPKVSTGPLYINQLVAGEYVSAGDFHEVKSFTPIIFPEQPIIGVGTRAHDKAPAEPLYLPGFVI